MFKINGKYASAKIFTANMEETATSQVYNICNHPIFKDEKIRIMPDVHAGMGCVIGFTSTCTSKKIIPNLIGVDIGCGMLTATLGKVNIDYQKLDEYIRKEIPHGNAISNKIVADVDDCFEERVYNTCATIGDKNKHLRVLKSLGSLGGGNHFIEINKDNQDNKYLVVHSGSRNFGYRIATYYQNLAIENCITKGFSKELAYLENELAGKYIEDMNLAQEFATRNRVEIVNSILRFLNITAKDNFETIHNYIDKDNMIRKGAISAKKNEKILIPLNMRDGSILATGKGNEDWNCSAPHGAGRLLSRSNAKRTLSLNDFKAQMSGIYTTSVNENTIDEAPMAYKPYQEIIENIKDSVDIIDILEPQYNFKA